MKIIKLNEIIKDDNVKIELGLDMDDIPVYLGDTVYQEIVQSYSPSYHNGYEHNTISVPKSKPKEYRGIVYRKVEFRGSTFILNRIKEEGWLPIATSGTEWASIDNLKEYKVLK